MRTDKMTCGQGTKKGKFSGHNRRSDDTGKALCILPWSGGM